MPTIAVFLQNAWGELFAGKTWPRDSWLQALQRSRSGKRLLVLEKAARGVNFYYDNTTPICGATVDSIVKPDPKHVVDVLESIHNLEAVVACGKQAEATLSELWAGKLLVVPHPAARLLKDRVYKKAGTMLRNCRFDRVKLRIGRSDRILIDKLPNE